MVKKALRWDLPREVQSVFATFCHVLPRFTVSTLKFLSPSSIIPLSESREATHEIQRSLEPLDLEHPWTRHALVHKASTTFRERQDKRFPRWPSYISKRPCARSSWCGLMKSSFSRLSACILGQHKRWRSASCFKAPRHCFCINRVLIAKTVSIYYLKYWTYHVIAETWFQFSSIFYTSHINDEFSAR